MVYIVLYARLDERRLPVVEHHPHFIKTHLVVGMVQGYRLFRLRTRKHVAGVLVVFGAHDLVAEHAQMERGVNFAVRVIHPVGGARPTN